MSKAEAVSLKHKMLIASASMQDDGFAHTVIFILEHDEGRGAFGVAVNRKADPVPCTCGQGCKSPFDIYLGGPCDLDSRFMMIHGIPRVAKDKKKIMDGLWHGSPKTVRKILHNIPMDDHRFKVITGYCGWGPGQLENEISLGAWHITDATPELVLDGDPTELWESLLPPDKQPRSRIPKPSMN